MDMFFILVKKYNRKGNRLIIEMKVRKRVFYRLLPLSKKIEITQLEIIDKRMIIKYDISI